MTIYFVETAPISPSTISTLIAGSLSTGGQKCKHSLPEPPHFQVLGGGVLVTCFSITDHLQSGNQQLMWIW